MQRSRNQENGMLKEWNNGHAKPTIPPPHYSSIPIFHYSFCLPYFLCVLCGLCGERFSGEKN